jgi:hypothetical protein
MEQRKANINLAIKHELTVEQLSQLQLPVAAYPVGGALFCCHHWRGVASVSQLF